MKPLLIVLDDWEGLIKASSCWKQLDDNIDIKFLDKPISIGDEEEIKNAQFLLALRERTRLDEGVFERMPDLKVIFQTGGHAYHIDVAAARKRNILIALGRKAKAPLLSVPELTFAFILGISHKLYLAHSSMQKGKWELVTGRTLSGRRLGVLGMGRHGTRVAQIAQTAFNMEVVAWDRGVADIGNTSTIKRLPLEELLSTSDVVSIHLKLSKESTGLLNKERLSFMKRDAILINTARGAIVDENALTTALQEGKLAGAGLDVFVQEPLAADSPLRKLENVILSPHVGWTVQEVFEEFANIACEQLLQYMGEGIPPAELLDA